MDIVGLIHIERALFGIIFPDLPGCVSVGDNFQDVMEMGAEALSLHLEGMLDDDDVIPPFRPLAELEADPEFDEDFAYAALAVHFAIKFSGKVVTVTFDLEDNPLKQLKAAAE